MSPTVRLDKYLSSLGFAPRRGVEQLLLKQTITINGKRVYEPGIRINPAKDKILVNGKELKKPQLVYYMVNKPTGVISTARDERGRKTVVSLIKTHLRIYPVGRLDSDSTGLMLLTNDGGLANRLIHPRYHVPKTYRLQVTGSVPEKKLIQFREGVKLEDGKTLPTEAKIIKQTPRTTTIQAILYEGRKRQIRRMCETLKIQLVELQRIKIGPLSLGSLAPGSTRPLSKAEVQALRLAVTSPSRTLQPQKSHVGEKDILLHGKTT